jgi:hypothetical protein
LIISTNNFSYNFKLIIECHRASCRDTQNQYFCILIKMLCIIFTIWGCCCVLSLVINLGFVYHYSLVSNGLYSRQSMTKRSRWQYQRMIELVCESLLYGYSCMDVVFFIVCMLAVQSSVLWAKTRVFCLNLVVFDYIWKITVLPDQQATKWLASYAVLVAFSEVDSNLIGIYELSFTLIGVENSIKQTIAQHPLTTWL